MAYSLEQIFGWMPLTESLRATSSGVPNPFPAELFNVKPQNRILGDRGKYIRISGERRTAPLAKYGAPARRHSFRDVGEQDVRMMHSAFSFPISMVMLAKLRAFEQYTQDEGMDFIRYQIDAAAKLHMNTRIITAASVLRYGAIYWDNEGNLLPSSSGAYETYSFNVPATHQNQCNGNVPSSWALANTDIPGSIRNLRQYAAEETGLPLDTCLYGKEVPTFMSQNNYVQSYLSRNAIMNERFTTSGEIPDGLFGIKRWIPVYTTFFEDQNGNNQLIWDDSLCVFMPDLSQPDKMDWWAMFEGSYPCPRSLEVQRDAIAALNNFEIVYGMGAYTAVDLRPPSLEVTHFDTWLPGLRNEKAIFQAEVAF